MLGASAALADEAQRSTSAAAARNFGMCMGCSDLAPRVGAQPHHDHEDETRSNGGMFEEGVELHLPLGSGEIPEAMPQQGGKDGEDAERTGAEPGPAIGDQQDRAD